MDTEAIAWAAQKLQAFAVDKSTMDNALMLDRLYAMLAAAPTPETTCLFPLIDAQFETVEKGITGTTSASVKRVEMRDDGSYTVTIDHWPAPTPPVCQACNGNCEIGGFVNAHSGYESEPCTDCATPPAQEYSCPCGLGDKPCPDETGRILCDDTPAQEDVPVALVRYGIKWQGLDKPICVQMNDPVIKENLITQIAPKAPDFLKAAAQQTTSCGRRRRKYQ